MAILNNDVALMLNRRISIAPMMDCTDRHFRFLARLISSHVFLYTEMVATGAVIHGDRQRLLGFSQEEQPLALQLGGSDPQALAQAAKIAEDWGYAEVNLNVGCPSDRVQAGRFGACLMKEPELVAACVDAMCQAVSIPVTVKTRMGVDDQDSYPELQYFIQTVASAGCKVFILHARKAWLKGLSPKENRNIPPLQYDNVYRLKQDFLDLEIHINGGIKTTEQIQTHLNFVDGVMLGREAYANPYLLAHFDCLFFNVNEEAPSRLAVLNAYLLYMREQLSQGIPLRHLTRHLVGLFKGESGAKAWRRYLSGKDILEQGVESIIDAVIPAKAGIQS